MAQAGTVTVVTSLSQEMMRAYRLAFERQHPGIRLEIVAKSTAELLREVEQRPAGKRPDVVWASSIEAFVLLARKGLLQPAPELRNPQVPAKVGPHALNDASGRYFGQSLSGYGIMWNSDYLRQRQIREPQEWQDLAQPAYAGHVVLSAPSRSGTTHLMVESMLQGLGWEQGWALLLQLAGNAAEISPDSYAVPRGIARGSYGAGLVIDAFGLAAKYSGMPVDFAYATMAPVLPASIGLVAGAHNPDGAKRFMAFTLSPPGQQLLLDPRINRLPVLPAAVLHMPAGYPDPYLQAQRSRLQFDVELSSTRYQLVSRLFDLVVTEPLVELQAATRAIHAADRALRSRSSRQGAALLASARKVAYTPVLPAMEASSRQWLAAAGAPADAQWERLQAIWSETARNNYRRARQLAEQALAQAQAAP
ncbi:ABC transporter substrate-binding protein [Comamonas terrigena NBRC 13299]|nr:extracellular solute-binding protein [Comamonas sp. CMM01]BBL24369.1 ABC transporter substrate-binding protein [Comamonas terrigena NBRC 13299]